MGEHVWTTFTVGGKGSHKLLTEDLAEVANCDFPGGDGELSVEELIAAALAESTSVTFQGECNYGRADEIKAFCQVNDLAYQTSWAAKGGVFDAGCEHWAPGMDAPIEQGATDDGEPTITLSTLKLRLDDEISLADVIAELGRAGSASVPPLEVDDLVARAEAA